MFYAGYIYIYMQIMLWIYIFGSGFQFTVIYLIGEICEKRGDIFLFYTLNVEFAQKNLSIGML